MLGKLGGDFSSECLMWGISRKETTTKIGGPIQGRCKGTNDGFKL